MNSTAPPLSSPAASAGARAPRRGNQGRAHPGAPARPCRMVRALATCATLASCAALAACSSDDSCGPASAATGDVVAAAPSAGVSLRFGQLRARPNNDCPAPDAPAGVVSLTLSGLQVGGDQPLTFCVPRPDLLRGARGLGVDVEVVDVSGADGACSFRLLPQPAPAGTVTATGVCDNGRDPAGFSLRFDGEVSVERRCGAAVDVLRMTLSGDAPVTRSDS
jgi:hypothetical protein